MELSIIMPCLNEEKTLSSCIRAAKKAISTLGISGEVIVADNGSSDRSVSIAESEGARVIHAPISGYGAAINAGVLGAYGRYVIIGDADESYDFSESTLMFKKLASGDADIVIGNRFRGNIEKGAMPFLNQFLGNPILSGIGRLLYGNVCGDFHCGLRGASRPKLVLLDLKATGMEYATEMIIVSALYGLRIDEVPVTLRKDGRDRSPHLRRWRDGMRHLSLLIRYRFKNFRPLKPQPLQEML